MADNLANKILNKALKLVPQQGWCDEVLEQSQDEQTFSNIKELVSYFLEENDRLMLKTLEKTNIEKLKIRQRIRKALIVRFKQHNKDILAKTLKFLSNPANSDLAFRSLSTSCNKIWSWAGDESTDFNFYSKRLLLAGVYSTSLIYYLKKTDMDLDDLSIFIENRLDDVVKLGSLKQKITNSVEFLRNFIKKS